MAGQPFSLLDLGAVRGRGLLRCEMEQMALRCGWACSTMPCLLRQPVPRVSENFVSDWISWASPSYALVLNYLDKI